MKGYKNKEDYKKAPGYTEEFDEEFRHLYGVDELLFFERREGKVEGLLSAEERVVKTIEDLENNRYGMTLLENFSPEYDPLKVDHELIEEIEEYRRKIISGEEQGWIISLFKIQALEDGLEDEEIDEEAEMRMELEDAFNRKVRDIDTYRAFYSEENGYTSKTLLLITEIIYGELSDRKRDRREDEYFGEIEDSFKIAPDGSKAFKTLYDHYRERAELNLKQYRKRERGSVPKKDIDGTILTEEGKIHYLMEDKLDKLMGGCGHNTLLSI